MTAAAPHPAYITREALELAAVYQLRTVGEVKSAILAQREADARAERCRELCKRMLLSPALVQALVSRAASERVVRAAARRFADWRRSIGEMDYWMTRRGREAPEPPSYPNAAAEIVDQCLRLESAGLLEVTVGGER